MAFDASPIASIGDSFDPAASKAKAYQLKDLIDQEQLSQLKLNQAKQGQADTAAVKKLLSKADISTPEGLMKAAQSLTSAGYADQGMQLMQEGQKTRQANESFTETHLKVLQASADIIGPAALQIMDTLKNQGPAMARAQYQQLVGQVLPQLPPELRQKIPAQPPQDDQQFSQLLQGAAQQSQQARQIVAQHLAQQKQDTTDKGEAEKERHDRAMEDAAAKKTGQGAKAPAGFEWDPDNPDQLRPIKGGPKDPNSKPWQGREKVFSERIVTSANEAARAIQNITELPVTASSGILGTGSGPGHSLFQSTRDALRNKLSDQETQDYNTMLAGVRRNLATIESVGLAPSGALTEGFGSLELRAGDTNMTKLRKLAEMRQIVDAGLEVQLADPAIPDSIKNVMHTVLDKVRTAVPYTQSDVTKLQNNPDMTLEQLMQNKGLGKTGGGPQKVASDSDYDKLPSGAEFIAPDGSHRRKP